MKKKLVISICFLLIGVLGITGCGSTEEKTGDNLQITFADYGSSAMPTADAYRYAIEHIREGSNDRVIIDYVPDAVLGNEIETAQQLMDGTMQMGILASSIFSRYTDKLEVFQLPFLITDYEKEQAAFNSPEGQALLDSVEDIGLKIIGYAENGIRHFANNKRPINTPADLQGLILRIVPSNMLQDAMNLLGANPTPLNYGDVYTALQNRVIDGLEVNITSLYAMKFYERISYVSEIGMYPFPALVVVNLDFWNTLEDEDQELILEGFRQGSVKLFEEYLPNYEGIAKSASKEAGVEFNVIEEKEAFRLLVMPIYEEYRAKDPAIAAFIEMIQGL